MPFPESSRLELPILQELKVTGGADQLRYLYDRLIRYFPQLTIEDLAEQTEAGRSRWHRHVQRAGRELEERGELRRERTRWTITPRGAKRVADEAMQVERNEDHLAPPKRLLTHQEAQAMLVEIGEWLGYTAAKEFERYDVVWRESVTSPRLSHVFEVQISGSVDSALARLKHAYDTQRSTTLPRHRRRTRHAIRQEEIDRFISRDLARNHRHRGRRTCAFARRPQDGDHTTGETLGARLINTSPYEHTFAPPVSGNQTPLSGDDSVLPDRRFLRDI